MIEKQLVDPIVSNPRINNLVAGDLWTTMLRIDYIFMMAQILFCWSHVYTKARKTGFEADSVLDDGNVTRTVLKLFVGGVLAGVHSRVQFRPGNNFEIQGYPVDANDTQTPQRQLIKVGFNPVNPTGETYKYNGTAESAEALVDGAGTKYDFTKFVATTGDQNMTGSLFVKNSGGLAIGVGDSKYHAIKIDGTTTVFENQQGGSDIDMRIRVGNSTTVRI